MKLRWWFAGYLLVLAVVLLSPLRSTDPDGFQKVAGDNGFMDRAANAPYSTIANYVMPGIENRAMATILAGAVGATIAYALVGGLAYLAHRRVARRRKAS